MQDGTERRGLVMGGARGTGQAIARALAEAGMRLILTDEDAAAAEAAARPLGATGLACLPMDGGSVGRLAYAASDAAGDLDLLVLALNGAGRAAPTDAEFDAATHARMRPLFHLVRHFAPAMLARGQGAVLMVLTLPPGPDVWAEAAAGWVAGAVRALAADWAASGVTINALVVRRDDSPALPRFMTRPAPAPVPLGRLPQPAEIASAALALCGPAVTGQVLRLDGGSG